MKTFFYELFVSMSYDNEKFHVDEVEIFVHSLFEKNPFLKGAPGQKMIAEIT